MLKGGSEKEKLSSSSSLPAPGPVLNGGCTAGLVETDAESFRVPWGWDGSWYWVAEQTSKTLQCQILSLTDAPGFAVLEECAFG